MKKVLLYMFFLIFLCFAIPIIFTYRRLLKEDIITSNYNIENNTIDKIENGYDYKNYSMINVLHKEEGKVEKMKLDNYLYGVVSAEMPASFETEALKAQAVVARTYTIYKIINNNKKHGNADICDDPNCCQAWISKDNRLKKWSEENRNIYWNKIVNCVDTTQGKIITYGDKPINAFFHANSGGATEAPINVWGGNGYPYLQTVETSGEDAYKGYSSNASFTKEEFIEKIRKYHEDFKINFDDKDCIKIKEYTEGNRVKVVKIGNLNLSGVEVRNIFSLRSANFSIELKGNEIKFEVIGYGHGVGMSQTGADSLAKQGKTYEEIIKHYYTGVKIENI